MGAKKKILFIDDEVGFLGMVKLNIESQGPYEVLTESRASRALEVARQFRPDMIFLDVIMPEADGGDLYALMMEDKELASIPVVFLTAMITEKETDTRGSTIAGRVFIPKPVTTQKLLEYIEKTIG